MTILGYPGLSRFISYYLGLSGIIFDYLAPSRAIWVYLGLFRTRVQVEPRESKLLIFETFLVLFFTNKIYRGARAPKNMGQES